jgi:hypothetical protein
LGDGEALVVRAGALGDVLLLRRAVATLRRAHHRVLLIAPGPSGTALLGPGPSEVDALFAWERSDVAALFTGDGPEGPLRVWPAASAGSCRASSATTRRPPEVSMPPGG